MFNRKTAIAATLLAIGTVCAGSAQAHVNWSVGINLPPVGFVTSVPVYQAPEPYYAPAPVYVQPAPVYVQPEPVVEYRQVPVYAPRYYDEPQVIRSGWAVPGYGWRHERHERHDWREGRYDEHRGDRRDDHRDNRDGRHDEYGDPHHGDHWEGRQPSHR